MASQADVKSHHLHLDTVALPTRTLRPSSSLSKLSASWRRKATAAATTTTPLPPPPPLPSPRPPSSLPHPHSKSSLSPPRPAFFYDGKSAASASESSLLLSSSSPSSSSPSVSRGSLDSDFIKPPSTMPSMKRLLARRGSGEAVHDRERERQARNDNLEHPQTPERVRSPSPNNVNMAAAAAAATAQKTTTNGDTLRNIGRRLFSTNNNASSAAAPSYPTDRSHSYSSESTVNSSPPRTPPSPQNAFQYTGNLPQLPPLASLSSSAPSSDAFAISPKSKIPATTLIPPTPPLVIPPRRSEPENAWVLVEAEQQRQQQQQHRATTQRAAAPRPTAPTPTPLPATTLRSTPLASTTTDFFDDSSDILQAVLSLGNDDEGASLFRNDAPTTTRTPAAAPTAITNLSSSFSSTTSLGGSRRLMTEAQAAQIAEEQRKRRPKLTLRPGFSKRKSSLWAHDSDSDEYGRDDEDDDHDRSPREERKTARPPPLPLATSPTLPSSTSSLFPSSFSLGRKRSPSPSPTTPNFKDVIVTPPARDNTLSPPGLSTPAKRALYACTLLKVHPQLDSLLRPGSSTPSSPVEIRYPRSINTSTKLASAATNGGSQTGVAGAPLTLCSRNLSIALAQTQVMRKLRGRLPRHDEVEIGWFLRGYASELVSPEAIAKSLASRPQVSPEAQGLAASSSTPDRPGTPDSQQQPSGRVASATDGMATWASRAAFVERCVVTRGDDQAAFEIGEVVVNDGVRAGRGKSAARPGSLVFSPRVRILAGWPAKPSPKLPSAAFTAAKSPPAKRPAAAKAPPPWIAPRSRGLRAAPVPPATNPHVEAAHDKLTASASVATPAGLTPAQSIVLETRRRQSVSEVIPPTPDSVAVSLPESEEQAFETAESGTDDDDDVPIASLHQIRRRSTIASISFDATTLKPPSSPGGDTEDPQRPRPLSPFEQERISRLEGELERLRRRDRDREQELLRVQAERRLEENKRQVQAARERRHQNQTELKAVLQDPRYGAGDAMATHRGSLRQSVSLADVGAVHAAHQGRLQQPQPQRWPGMGDPPMSIPSRAAPPPSPSMARVASPPPPSARAMACSSPPPRPGLEQAFSPHERAHSSNEVARLSRRQSTLMSPPSFGGFNPNQYSSSGPYLPHAMSSQAQLHRQSSMVGSTSMVQLSGAHPHSHLLASSSDLHQPRRRSNAMLHGSPQLQQVQQQPYQHHPQQPAWHHHHHQLHSVPSFGQLHQPQPLVMLQHNDVPSSARSSRGMM